MIPPFSQIAALALAETLLNRYLQADIEMASQLESLAGKVVLIKITGLNWHCYLLPYGCRIQLQAYYAGVAHTTLAAPPFTWLKILSQPVAGVEGDLQIEGEVETGQRLQSILRALNVDIEAVLARVLGDVPAHQLHYQQQRGKAWLRQVAHSLGLDLQEYLQQEIRSLPSALELEPFYRQVDQLRDDAARLSARVQRLTVALKG